MKNTLKALLIPIACISLAACANFTKAPHNKKIPWQQRRATLLKIKSWHIRGAIALATSKQSFSASLHWQQSSINHYQVDLFGPLGIGAVSIVSTPGKVTLKTSDNKTITGKSAEALLQQQLGWKLPINRLYYWIRGLRAPGSHAKITFDRYHHILSLSTRNWQVHYLHYTAVGLFDLPQKIRLTTPFSRVVIVINRWQLN